MTAIHYPDLVRYSCSELSTLRLTWETKGYRLVDIQRRVPPAWSIPNARDGEIIW